jgi:hypothetical protein
VIVDEGMRSSRLIAAAAASVLVAACGEPSAGDRCDNGGYVCQDDANALECRDGTWRALPCRGPGGCEESGRTVDCDVSQNLAGDACAESSEGYSICAADGRAVLECRTGTFQQTHTCSNCYPSDPILICDPP